jgi:hypothetical protein
MKQWIGRGIAAALVFLAIWAVSLPFVIGALDKDIAARAAAEADFPLRLGVGGTGCTIEATPSQIATADRLRLVADRAPGSADVVIYLFPIPHTVDAKVISPYPIHRRFDGTATCVSEDLPSLDEGDYQAWIHIGNDRAHVDFHVSRSRP